MQLEGEPNVKRIVIGARTFLVQKLFHQMGFNIEQHSLSL